MLPPEREVDCSCAIPLPRPVGFDPTGRNTRVTGCVRCGVVTVVEAMVDEPRPHDVRCVGNQPLVVEPKLLAFLGALAQWLDEIALDAQGLHTALETVAHLGKKAQALASPLERLAARIGDSDYYLKKRVTELAARVRRPK